MSQESTTRKYFDDKTANDLRGTFFTQASPICFKNCVNLVEKDLTTQEKNCIVDCYTKMLYAFENAQKI